jgi:hypothetical protein
VLDRDIGLGSARDQCKPRPHAIVCQHEIYRRIRAANGQYVFVVKDTSQN